ncbi:rCG42398 [Rattus norvegicus]|uniref:RCG42398 n=1 Tax=Rattus norvegicus TaxID=10116 RepID=A6KFW2_RAT|nr:rCG42398 [Rattus norvegicus]
MKHAQITEMANFKEQNFLQGDPMRRKFPGILQEYPGALPGMLSLASDVDSLLPTPIFPWPRTMCLENKKRVLISSLGMHF